MTRAALMMLLLIPCSALAQQVSCPLTVPEGTIQVARSPIGWLTETSSARLVGAAMFLGHPRQEAIQVPSKTVSSKNSSTDTWEFRAGDEKWLWCSYGGESVHLYKRMDDASTTCTIISTSTAAKRYSEVTATCT